jgi:hypothetical protein
VSYKQKFTPGAKTDIPPHRLINTLTPKGGGVSMATKKAAKKPAKKAAKKKK